MFSFTGVFSFLSYRDPNLLKTLNVYDGTGDFLRELAMDDDTLTKAIIGTIGDVDAYQLPDAKGYSRYVDNCFGSLSLPHCFDIIELSLLKWEDKWHSELIALLYTCGSFSFCPITGLHTQLQTVFCALEPARKPNLFLSFSSYILFHIFFLVSESLFHVHMFNS